MWCAPRREASPTVRAPSPRARSCGGLHAIGTACSPYLLCPRRPLGDTFLSLNLLLNESPLRSRRSICVSTGAPFLPLTSGGLAASPCRAANITYCTLCAGTINLSFESLPLAACIRRELGPTDRFNPSVRRADSACRFRWLPTALVGSARTLYSSRECMCWSCSAAFCAACAMLRGAPCISGPRAVGRTSTGRAEVALCAANVSRRARDY